MQTFSLSDAKARLSRLIELVEAGEEVTITKRGRPVVKLVSASPARQQLPSLADLRARLPGQNETAGEFVRGLRESDRY